MDVLAHQHPTKEETFVILRRKLKLSIYDTTRNIGRVR